MKQSYVIISILRKFLQFTAFIDLNLITNFIRYYKLCSLLQIYKKIRKSNYYEERKKKGMF
jgi:hypothetical protein